jgi:hypothetical protein
MMRLKLSAVFLALAMLLIVCGHDPLFAQAKPTFGSNCEDALALIDFAALDVMK